MRQSPHLEDGPNSAAAVLENGKKNILLIGDSIRCGYCGHVKAALADVANVFFPGDNCRSTQFVITSLYSWSKLCDPAAVDAVYFNCGHWDAAHWNGEDLPLTPLAVYEQNIGRIIHQLRRLFVNAKIYFATTTPMNPNKQADARNPRTTEELRRYNAAAIRAAQAQGVEINDLFSLMEKRDESWYLDYCHYTPRGYALLGDAVAAFLRERVLVVN
ncbi:MAG: GDSL-type esterase/lipase family protein [Oscillospiraceae bacterium]|jgi:lysophospholipase L1-like esterase|nr:GDSL-type esterase/lipase family protein [Oscillospiraceae bacterium]